ncbi:flagellar basal body P-ring formation chaperone FlgA [Pseudoteredinibacter isoporae]|uniref:Flagella basal body P-ring formation protein FlgA n=1 Tax=Pseudoteredinibacter isoporae TaxID=570281 RepID=A0A7X0MZT6_9GAMM|nr:flagellar basal body P-ring formation chaperone FlgA [Pseudoteredinibacter isoporae]MBB6523502.1 flagella basal body P-ring formation protein FlgA [Pseudoteredinibacter isoporae]NHO89011.1 flagellar basal body P-ring formation protein FlgA [Pseudoteredinibacter isoporae]NIB24281.1 flagellar basal body P-ring formation protein FlgA [Pseudoteredinibacter isoporae]
MTFRQLLYPFALGSTLLFSGLTAAQPDYNSVLKQETEHYLKKQYTELLQRGYERVDVRVNAVDRRLRLTPCSAPLNFEQSNPSTLRNQASVRVSCSAPKPWAIFISARISAYAKILVAAQPLVRGQILEKDDIIRQSKAVSPNHTLLQEHQLIGQQLKRALPQGEAIRANFLTPPRVIRRGDNLILAARLGSASVSTSATALADGKVGEQIRVKNNRSEQIVKARVVAPGRVEVVL